MERIHKWNPEKEKSKTEFIYSEPICGTSILYKRKSGGLPMNILVDDAGQWKKWKYKLPRIEFQTDRGDATSKLASEGIPMEISNNPEIPESVKKHNPKHDFSESEIELLKKLGIIYITYTCLYHFII